MNTKVAALYLSQQLTSLSIGFRQGKSVYLHNFVLKVIVDENIGLLLWAYG